MANEIRAGVRTLNLSASQLKKITSKQGAEWSNELINDYLTILDNFIRIANATDDIIEQVDSNTENIAINVENILINKDAIALVAENLQSHEDSYTVHGVTGTVIGTEDYPNELIGGAVKRSELVTDISLSSTEIITDDLLSAPAAYDASYTELHRELTNQEKAKINTVITDLEAIRDTFNDLLNKSKAAEQMTS